MKQIIKYCGLYKSSHQLSEKKTNYLLALRVLPTM